MPSNPSGAFVTIAVLALIIYALLAVPSATPGWAVLAAFILGAFVMLFAVTPRRPR